MSSSSDEDLKIILGMPSKPQDQTTPAVSAHFNFSSTMHVTFKQRVHDDSSTDSDLEKILGMHSSKV